MNLCYADSRPKLIAGSPEGYSGHVDGRTREARMNHPKGMTMDDRGNIYIADTMNMAIRKITDAGMYLYELMFKNLWLLGHNPFFYLHSKRSLLQH